VAQQAEAADHLRGKGKKGERVEDRKEGTTEGIEEERALLYPGQAARGRVARSGGAKPKGAAHRQLFYTG
jgi:hypothetical protein